MKIGFQSSAYNDLSLLQELIFANEHNVDFFDIFFDGSMPCNITDKEFALIQKMRGRGFDFTVHLPINIDRCSESELLDLSDFIKNIKPVTATVHFDKLDYNLLEKLALYFSNDTRLCIENTIPDYNPFMDCNYLEFMIKACKQYPVSATFDTGHCNVNLTGHNKSDSGKICILAKQLIQNGIQILTVHNHDNHGIKDEHGYIGSGNINFENFYTELKNADQSPMLVIEHWTDNLKSLAALKLIS